MNLTKEQKKRLAEKVREVASECAEGVPLKLGVYRAFVLNADGLPVGPNCFLGHAMWRADLADHDTAELPDERWLVTDANDYASSAEDRRRRVVFPALALADALEEGTNEALS
jgi:hypothetical protein